MLRYILLVCLLMNLMGIFWWCMQIEHEILLRSHAYAYLLTRQVLFIIMLCISYILQRIFRQICNSPFLFRIFIFFTNFEHFFWPSWLSTEGPKSRIFWNICENYRDYSAILAFFMFFSFFLVKADSNLIPTISLSPLASAGIGIHRKTMF